MLPPTSFTLSRCRRPCRGAQCHCWRVVASSPSPFRFIYRRCEDVELFGALYTHHLYNTIIAVHFARRGWGEPNSCFTLALFVRSPSLVLSPHWYAVDIEMETNFTFPFSSSPLPVCSSSSSHNYKSNHLVLTPIIGYWSTAPHQPPLVVNMTDSNQVEFGEMETELNRFNQRQLDWIEELPSWNSIKWNHRSVRCCCQVNDGQTDR